MLQHVTPPIVQPGTTALTTTERPRRVSFAAHALLAGELSTKLIDQRLRSLGRPWPQWPSEAEHMKWFTTHCVPTDAAREYGAQEVELRFYIIPLLAPKVMKLIGTQQGLELAAGVARQAIREIESDGVESTIGWGALTKNLTHHGQNFLGECDNVDHVATTHGDAGTAWLVMKALEALEFEGREDLRISVIGANGVIGSAVSRALPWFSPESIMLVGRHDRQGEEKRLRRLQQLQSRVEAHVGERSELVEVVFSQDYTAAMRDHDSNVVIVATQGVTLEPHQLPAGAVVLDVTTPAACDPLKDWGDRLIMPVGCGIVSPEMVPSDFANMGGRILDDVGAGGRHVLWGCALETIAQSMFGYREHVVGQDIDLDHMCVVGGWFDLLGIRPQLPPCGWDAAIKRANSY